MSIVPDTENTATKQKKVKASEKKSPSTPVQLPTQGEATRTACIWDRPTPMVVNLPMKVEGEHQHYLQCQPGVNPAAAATLVVGSSPGQTGFALKVENGNSSGSSGPDSSAMMVDENSPGSSTASNGEHSAMNGSSGAGGDMEGVWSQDIDQAFQEALAIYPACGRRKIILSEEGKMYGRNELIARYIKIRCGKTRTRKQVSSHIQVLARKKQRETRARLHESTEENGFDSGCGGTAVSNGGAKAVAMTSSSSSSSLQPPTINSVRCSLPAVRAALSPPGFNAAAAAGLLNVIDMGTSAGGTGESKTNGVVAGGGGMWPYASSGGVNGGMAALGAYYNAPSMRKTIRDDPQFYQQFAAAALAGVSFASNPSLTSTTSTSSSLQSAFIPSTTFPLGHDNSVGKPPPEEGAFTPDTCGFTMASSKLVLCDFIAYVEQHGVAAASGSDSGRVDLVRIPKVFDDPMETIRLEAIQQKYPDTLHELFKTGPSDAFFLAKCWANMAFDPTLDNKTINYAVDSLYESSHNFDINVATKVCSFGSQVVEKVEVYSPVKQTVKNEDGGVSNTGEPLYRFTVEKSPMCDYMTRFITELRKLEAPQVMDSVLENFTVLQVITDKATEETLMVIAFIFQVSPDPESSCRIYRLVK